MIETLVISEETRFHWHLPECSVLTVFVCLFILKEELTNSSSEYVVCYLIFEHFTDIFEYNLCRTEFTTL